MVDLWISCLKLNKFLYDNVASLSAAIAILTLLPLPIFDGEKFIYLLIETIRGKQISSNFRRRFRLLSIFLLLVFAAAVFLLNLVAISMG